MLVVSPRIRIPDAELIERFVRAGGPGGQNVNKVASAVELRFDVARSPSLPDAVRARLLARADRRLSAQGVLVIAAQRFRTQDRNRADARARLVALIRAASVAPKARVATAPTRASQERRVASKKRRAQLKQGRGQRGWDHD